MIRLYDTMERRKRDFVPADPKAITMYVCGPTVYGRAHIGNARPAVVFDTLRRLIEHQFGAGSLTYARNVTDIDDKIIAAAEAEGVEPSVITERYERFYLQDMRALGVADPTISPHATAEIPAMIAMIKELMAKGYAYAAEGHVLFDITSDKDYGSLSRRDREAMIAGARVEIAPYKRDPADFILWKPSADGVIGWDSPWGRGRPGWHIECSAMIAAHLGETIDIHGGGLDLIFPHHENEIAQSRCAHGGKPLARYWVHNGFVDMGAEKMSKSIGNVVTVDGLLAEGHRGEVLRLALLSGHYRQPLPWTELLIEQQRKAFERWCAALLFLGSAKEEADFVAAANQPSEAMLDAVSDDLNTPKAIAILHSLAASVNSAENEDKRLRLAAELAANAKLLGLELSSSKTTLHESLAAALEDDEKPRVDKLVADRAVAKSNRDFATADRIRDELKAEGILLEDGPGGTTWRRA